MQNKIRLAQEQKVPYMLVLGDREVEARTGAPRARRGAGEQQEPSAGRTSPTAWPRRPRPGGVSGGSSGRMGGERVGSIGGGRRIALGSMRREV